VSLERPGDGVRCDHCNCAATNIRDGRLGFLAANRGERLCSLCIEVARQAEVKAATTDPDTGLRFIRVEDWRYRR
jgi:hypothetical protein